MSRTRSTPTLVVLTAAASLVLTLAQNASTSPAVAAVKREAPATQITEPVTGTGVPILPAATQAATPDQPDALAWPGAGQVVLDLPASPAAREHSRALAPIDVAGLSVRAGLSPASADRTGPTAPGLRSLTVTSLGRQRSAALGVDGPAFQLSARAETARDVTGAPETIELSVGYAGFADARGGDWATRLHLVRIPACATTATHEPGCAPVDVPSVNDSTDKTVTATISWAPTADTTETTAAAPTAQRDTATTMSASEPMTFALTAGPSGGAGDYTATPLSGSSAWQVGQQTGDFSWGYPLRVPPGVNGPVPDLSIGYSSGSVDGRTSSTNNQPSWIGEGHDLGSGYIERKYVACADDMTGGNNTTQTGDLCWSSDNATLVLAGHSSDLVKDTATGGWRLRDDDASRVERLTGASNGDNDTEYWKLTTTDGTQYFFGLGKRFTGDTEDTNSTWTVPVFGNQPGEPCHAATFAASTCQQGWRWNLDYVVDTNQNSMTYFYAAESNNYGRNLNTAVSAYTRGGYLTRIDYGQRRGTENTGQAPARVVFGVAERCLPSGSITCDPAQLTSANASYWPDVPFDQICTSSSSCPGQVAPAFFTRKRLTAITTQTWSGTAYTDVETWSLTHEFKDPGDSTSKSLWLAAISHSGKVAGTADLPQVTFVGTQMPNRVDGIDMAPPLIKWRVSSINTDTGATISVNYTPADCTPTSLPASPETNTRRCFPVYWTPEGQPAPSLNYFHKYLVSSVVETDRTGGGLSVQTAYDYIGDPAWHFDQVEAVPAKYRTYGQWRGYGTVEVKTGGSGEPQTRARTLFLRGMDDDVLPGGGRRQVVVTDSTGGTVEDHPALNGFIREQITYDGTAGAEVEGTISDPWISPATASNGTVNAYLVNVAATRSRTPLAAGGTRTSEIRTSYDGYGMPTEVNDLADPTTATDDLCTRTTYTRNTGTGLLDSIARAETVSTACTNTPNRPADVVSDQRYSYDGAGYGTPPTAGNVTRTETLDTWAGGPVYATTATSTYDSHGRVLTSTDGLNRTTSTAYTPTTGGPVTAVTTTNPAGHISTTTLQPAWGLPTATVDANNKRTDLTYDPLGRVTAVWLPNRSKTGGATANLTYEYLVRTDGPVAVATRQLRNNGTYTTSWALYDSMLRPRQTQSPAPGPNGGRVLTDTVYDTHGWVVEANGPYYATGSPSSDLLAVPANQLPAQTLTSYDGAGRPTVQALRVTGTEKWRTTTTYGGDRTNIDPPDGDTATTTITDARGRTTELRQYHGPAPTGAYDTTRYTYTPAGQPASLIDPAANTWTYGYDLRGRQTSATDPDRGTTTTTTYDNTDQPVTSTDARGSTLARTYDLLGRQTSLRDNTTTGPLRASWVYDTLAKGQLTSATRYIGADQYIQAITGYDANYHPTGTRTTIPATEGALAGTYTTAATYNIDGGLKTATLPVAAGLSNETLRYSYDSMGVPVALAGNGAYVAGTTYSPYGQVLQYSLGQYYGKAIWQTYFYEEGTRRLQRQLLDRETAQTTDADTTWAYDPAGNLTSTTDTRAPSGGDSQCYTTDYLRRLTDAWTPTTANGCTAPKSISTLGGPAPYWNTYTYDQVGNRLTATNRTPTTSADTSYAYPAPGAPRPHAATTATTTGTGAGTSTYAYDPAGNTTTRALPSGTQTLTWDNENHLDTVTTPAGTTSYLYDANGARLLRKEPGATTLYLAGTEIRLDTATATKTSTRHYTLNGDTLAVRTAAGVQFLTADQHGTAGTAVHASTMTITVRRSTPFGETRGTPPPTWPGQRGFVGGTQDPSTGLTQLGARPYDPTNGRFISVDPLLDPTNPQQWNAYSYGLNNPTTFSDPDGLEPRPWHAPGGFSNCARPNQPECNPTAFGGNGYSLPAGTNNHGKAKNHDYKPAGTPLDAMRHPSTIDRDTDGFVTPAEATAAGYDLYRQKSCSNWRCDLGAAIAIAVPLAVGACAVFMIYCATNAYTAAVEFASGGSITATGTAATVAAVTATRTAARAGGAPGARFIANSSGDVLDTTRVWIPEGKFGYLLKDPSKSGVFSDSMGFNQAGLGSALRSHLVDNFGSATPSVPMTGGGTKFTVRGPMSGPSGQTWNITSAWGVDIDGSVRLITATP